MTEFIYFAALIFRARLHIGVCFCLVFLLGGAFSYFLASQPVSWIFFVLALQSNISSRNTCSFDCKTVPRNQDGNQDLEENLTLASADVGARVRRVRRLNQRDVNVLEKLSASAQLESHNFNSTKPKTVSMPISKKTCHRSEIDCSNSAQTDAMCICKSARINARHVILNKKEEKWFH